MKVVLGFIGFGEAAYHISEGLIRSAGIGKVYAYDLLADHPVKGLDLKAKADLLGVDLVPSMECLCEQADIILSTTSAKAARPVAADAYPFLTPRHLYVDMNAASAEVKRTIAENLASSGVLFVDAAVMESVPGLGYKVPIHVSGTGALAFEQFGKEQGMNVTYISDEAGCASAVKMLRSIFMKGLTAVLYETLAASEAYGAADAIIQSIQQTLQSKPLVDTIQSLITRTAIHAERRVAEMDEVMRTLGQLGTDGTMSRAAREKLKRFVEMGFAERFHHRVPSHYRDVLREEAAIMKTGVCKP